MFRAHGAFAKVVGLLLWASVSLVSATEYTSGATKVDATIEYFEPAGSNTKCAKYLSGAPEKYDYSCFGSFFTDGGANSTGVLQGCDAFFGKEKCNSCSICENDDEEKGFDVDCGNLVPLKSTPAGTCIVHSDASVQEFLVGDTFADQPFDFTDNSTSPMNEMGDGKPPAGSSGSTQLLSNFSLGVVVLSLVTLTLLGGL